MYEIELMNFNVAEIEGEEPVDQQVDMELMSEDDIPDDIMPMSQYMPARMNRKRKAIESPKG